MKLVITEKPSVAREIARVLGVEKQQIGFLEGTEYLITWCVGHLVEALTPEEYNEDYKKWNVEQLPMIPSAFRYKASSATVAQYNCIQRLCRRCDISELICATDAGREGELIFRLVYNSIGCTKPFKRLWISSMEPVAIQKGFETLRDGHAYDNLFAAAEARNMADWIVGINATRLFSCLFHSKLNIGRVQTPTINMIVQRAATIAAFQPVPYYVLSADDGVFQLTHRFEEAQAAQLALTQCAQQPCVVTEIKKAEKVEAPPRLFDLTTLQREANKMFGFSAQHTLDTAQSLYEKRLLTYPRTDSRFITEDMQSSFCTLYGLLRHSSLVMGDSFPELAHVNVEETVSSVVNNAKVTDHHALLITAAATGASLVATYEEHKLLQLVAYRMLAACHRSLRYEQTSLQASIEGVVFSGTFKQVQEKGFTEITQWLPEQFKGQLPEQASTSLPPLEKGQFIKPVSLRLEEKKTEPPKHYTEDTLLSAMEHAGRRLDANENQALDRTVGLGTPATRAAIIERILATGYVIRKEKLLLPTEKANKLMPLLPCNLTSAELTAEFEFSLDEIAQGKLQQAAFMKRITDYINDLVIENKNRKVDATLFNEAGSNNESVGVCPRCGQQVVESKFGYSCKSGKDGCGFIIWKNDKFWTDRGKPLTKSVVVSLLSGKNPVVKGLRSKKTGKRYDAYIFLEDTGKYVNFKMEFEKG